jgi:hypothetical protein
MWTLGQWHELHARRELENRARDHQTRQWCRQQAGRESVGELGQAVSTLEASYGLRAEIATGDRSGRRSNRAR